MRLATTLLFSVVGATLALTVPIPTADVSLYPSAEAATNISISIGTFYDDLAPYGSWVHYEDAYVFVPSRVRHGWRPYTIGHWVYTRRYGWLWVSDEPFGWAAYHYGRWGFSQDIGWYWIPGRRWAPAWVSWRRSRGYVVWAPLPPRFDDDFSIEITVRDIPDYYWVAVPSRSFLEVDLSASIIDDDHGRFRAVEETKPVGNVTIQNNIVVNNAIDVGFVEKETKQQVKPVEVKETDNPKQAGKGGAGEVAVFTGEVKQETDAKPAQVKEVQEVTKERAKQEKQAPGTAGATEQSQGGKKKKKLQTEEQIAAPDEAQQQQGEGQPTGKKVKKEEVQPQPGAEQPAKKKKKATGQPEEAQPQQSEEQPVKKKKKATKQSTQPQEVMPQQGQEQPVKKKKKAAVQSSQGAEPLQKSEEPVQTKRSRKEKVQPEPETPTIKSKKNVPSGCDPATGEGCAQ